MLLLTQINGLRQRDAVPIVLMEVYVSGLAGGKLASGLIATYRRITMVDGDVVADRIVPAVHLTADAAHEAVRHTVDVLFVATPALKCKATL